MSRKIVTIAAVSGFILGGLGVAGASAIPTVAALRATPAVTVAVPGPVTTVKVPGPVTTVKVPGPVTTVKVPGPVTTVTVKAVAAPALSAVIENGQWEVGVDVPAGAYKVTAAVDPDAMCYWKISQTGKPDNIIDNDIVKGGKPTVTVKRGQDFTTKDCGTWAQVR
jgi:hypothetical protein